MIEEIRSILKRNSSNHGGLISTLEDIQAKYSYLPAAALGILASETGRSLVDVYGVATFYKSFSLKARGKHLCSVCKGTACHVRGAQNLAEEFERQLGVEVGETTSDKEITLESVACLGACALGPIVLVDGHYFSNVGTGKVKRILKKTKAGLDEMEVSDKYQAFRVEVSCPHCNHSFMNPKHLIEGKSAIRITASFERKHGWIMLSSLYGSYVVESEYEIPEDTILHLFCPHCHAELRGGADCMDCGAPMVPMIVRGGGIVQICSRRGCRNHMLDLTGVNL